MSTEAIEQGSSNLTGTARERIIRKIKRCLALGESSNQTEAETAMRQAQAMMDSYRLSEADVNASDVGADFRDTNLQKMPIWQRDLAFAAAAAFNCRLVYLGKHRWETQRLKFIGVMPAAELSAYAYDSLLAQIKTARKQFLADNRPAPRGMADDFCMGWVSAVLAKINAFAKETLASSDTANALVVIKSRDDAAIKAWMDQEHGDIRSQRETKLRHKIDFHAMTQGVISGKQAQLNQGITKTGDELLALGR